MWWWIHEKDVISVSYTGGTQEKIRVHPVAKLQEISESQVPITRGLSAPVRVKATKTRFMRQISCTLLRQECQSGLKRNDEDKMVYSFDSQTTCLFSVQGCHKIHLLFSWSFRQNREDKQEASRLSFRNCISCVFNCDNHLCIFIISPTWQSLNKPESTLGSLKWALNKNSLPPC